MILANEQIRFLMQGTIMHLKGTDLDPQFSNELFELNPDELESVASGPDVENDPGEG